jgi:hypothetical protein
MGIRSITPAKIPKKTPIAILFFIYIMIIFLMKIH